MPSLSTTSTGKGQAQIERILTALGGHRSPLFQAGTFLLHRVQELTYANTHPEGHVQEGTERKMMAQMFCNLQ